MGKVDQMERQLTTALREDTDSVPASAEEAFAQRYAMPAVAIASIKRAGKLASMHLLRIVSDDSFENLNIDTQIKVIELAMSKAFGKCETNSAYLLAQTRVAPAAAKRTPLGKQLDAIEDWEPPEVSKKSRGRLLTASDLAGSDVVAEASPTQDGEVSVAPTKPPRPNNVVDLDIPAYKSRSHDAA